MWMDAQTHQLRLRFGLALGLHVLVLGRVLGLALALVREGGLVGVGSGSVITHVDELCGWKMVKGNWKKKGI